MIEQIVSNLHAISPLSPVGAPLVGARGGQGGEGAARIAAFIFGLIAMLAIPTAAAAQQGSTPPVTMHISAGYDGHYRSGPTWLPVRVTLANRGGNIVDGTAEISDRTLYYPSQLLQPYAALYQTEVVLPPGAAKQVTLYLPSADVQGQIEVAFRVENQVVATASAQPVQWDSHDLTIGALTSDPASIMWLKRALTGGAHLALARLTPATLDRLPEALAMFDVIALTNVDTSVLDGEQWTALERYVRAGGGLLLIGGPTWQETLPRVPAALLPGRLAGLGTLPDRSLLRSLGVTNSAIPSRATAAVTLLKHPRGAVAAGNQRLPLVVRMPLGSGQVEYLAFDPSVDPLAQLPEAVRRLTLSGLVTGAAPMAAGGRALGLDSWSTSLLDSSDQRLDALSELSNTLPASMPASVPLIGLTVFVLLLLWQVRGIIRTQLERPSLPGAAIPAIALLLLTPAAGMAFHFKGKHVLVNTINAIQLDGNGPPYPATVHLGLFTPLPGDFHLQYDAPALPASDMPPPLFGGPSPAGGALRPPGWRFREGLQSAIDFLSMDAWSTRAAVLHTSTYIKGSIRGSLHLTASGDIVGTIRNQTDLTLLHPAIIAGSRALPLPDMHPAAALHIRVRPAGDVAGGQTEPLFQLYGRSSFSSHIAECAGGPVPSSIGSGSSSREGTLLGRHTTAQAAVEQLYGEGIDCAGPWLPPERSLTERIRNAVSMLPEARLLSTLGQVTLVGWTDRPLTALTVDGQAPHRRDLSLLLEPLTVSFPTGSFRLRPGTLAAHLVALMPVRPYNWCNGQTAQPVALGLTAGQAGSAIFEFDLSPGSHTHFRTLHLRLALDAEGANQACSPLQNIPPGIGQVYDWLSRRWVPLRFNGVEADLAAPNRFISPTGVLWVKLQPTSTTDAITILDPRRDLQISGD